MCRGGWCCIETAPEPTPSFHVSSEGWSPFSAAHAFGLLSGFLEQCTKRSANPWRTQTWVLLNKILNPRLGCFVLWVRVRWVVDKGASESEATGAGRETGPRGAAGKLPPRRTRRNAPSNGRQPTNRPTRLVQYLLLCLRGAYLVNVALERRLKGSKLFPIITCSFLCCSADTYSFEGKRLFFSCEDSGSNIPIKSNGSDLNAVIPFPGAVTKSPSGATRQTTEV